MGRARGKGRAGRGEAGAGAGLRGPSRRGRPGEGGAYWRQASITSFGTVWSSYHLPERGFFASRTSPA